MELHSLNIGKKKIDYVLKRKSRKRIKINVHPDMSVEVIAPFDKEKEEIFYRVKKRAMWILKQQRYFEQFHPIEPTKEYVSGETHKYIGRQYRLKVTESDKNEVKLKGRYFYVHSKNKENNKLTEKLLYDWYRQHAKARFNDIMKDFLIRLNKYGIDEPNLSVRKMTSRWGSCNAAKQHILLNLELIKTPIHCIEYIIMHELCHLKHPNHNKEFYNFLTMMMPDWKMRKERLEKAGV